MLGIRKHESEMRQKWTMNVKDEKFEVKYLRERSKMLRVLFITKNSLRILMNTSWE